MVNIFELEFLWGKVRNSNISVSIFTPCARGRIQRHPLIWSTVLAGNARPLVIAADAKDNDIRGLKA